MLSVLANVTYQRLFVAQVLSLLGTGLTTVALGLLAYELAGERAGTVLATALTLKMVAYVGFAPIASAFVGRVSRRGLLITLDLIRAGLVLALPFVDAIWQIYVLVFAFQLCSAAFTPTFQGTIPDILTDERDYTRALSLSRLAYDLESLLSPMLAGLLLGLMSFHWLFAGTTLGFLASAVLVLSVTLPALRAGQSAEPFLSRATRGIRFYLATPRLRGLLALNVAVASTGAMVIVNSIVYVTTILEGTERTYTLVLMASGFGSMVVALALPRFLDTVRPRSAMLAGGAVLAVAPAAVLLGPDLIGTLAIWFVLGCGMSLVLTPSGLLLRQSAHAEDRPALFAAQFSMSHACWLAAYPLAGWLGIAVGLGNAFLIMGAAALVFTVLAMRLWPAGEPSELMHEHAALDHDHLHVHDGHHQHEHEGWEGPEPHRHPHRHGAVRHAHAFVIDDHHPRWPDPDGAVRV